MVQVSYPGVYVEELASGVRTITGVATSITAFVGYAPRGPDHRAKRIFNFGDFERAFGGLATDSEMSYVVQHFFQNGGTDAYVVRVPKSDAQAASVTLLEENKTTAKKAFKATAISSGAWANAVTLVVDNRDTGNDVKAFNLTLTDTATDVQESYLNVSVDRASARYVKTVVNDPDSGSKLVVIDDGDPNVAAAPPATGTSGGDIDFTALKNDKDYSVKVTSDLPAGQLVDVDVVVFAKGAALPTSVFGLAGQLERKINEAFATKMPTRSIAVRCMPSESGKGLQLFVDRLDGSPTDAVLSIAAGAPNNALNMLKLNGASSNASRYLLGKGRAVTNQITVAQTAPLDGQDGSQLPGTNDLIGDEGRFTGIYALRKVDLFNLLCIPDATRAAKDDPTALDSTVDPNTIYGKAITLCESRRAFLVIDPPPSVADTEAAADWAMNGLTVKSPSGYGGAYFPRLRLPDPLDKSQRLRTFAPCGVVAGLMARTDATRGVWKAPAGIDATLNNVQAQTYELTDAEHGVLNPLGLNCFRRFPVYGHVAWGARTLAGADAMASEWKYIPVRRLALYMEESLFRGTQWVVFEPNDEPLWAQIRLNVGAFMHSLFVQGAFAGRTPREAYLVKCDRETTTQDDINRGVVNILVGFAPLKPAEFVILRIQQLAGQIQT